MQWSVLRAVPALMMAALAAPVLAQPANDICSGATAVIDGDNPIDNTDATPEATLPCEILDGVYVTGPDIWFTYTAPETGTRTIEVTQFGGTQDTVLAIYDSCTGSPIACDDASGLASQAKIRHFAISSGVTYLIRVGCKARPSMPGSGNGTGNLRISTPPTPVAFDACSLATPVAGQPMTMPFNTTGLTTDATLTDCENFFGDGWFAWTPSVSGIGLVTTCNLSSSRTSLSLYDACAAVPLTCAQTYSGPNGEANCFPRSRVCAEVVAGQTYFVRVASSRSTQVALGSVLFDVLPITPFTVPQGARVESGTCSDVGQADANGGCDVTGEVPRFDPSMTFGQVSLCETITGTASARLSPVMTDFTQGWLNIDEDWYELTLDVDQAITISGQSQFVPRVRVLAGCPAIELARQVGGPACVSAHNFSLTTSVLVSGTYYISISQQRFNGTASNDCSRGSQYWMHVSGSVAPCSGACCTGTTCAASTQATCTGTYAGNGTACGAAGNPTTCCPANFNGGGGVTVQDIFDFLAAYFGGLSSADFNQSGGVSVQDIFDFLAAYFMGC